MLLFDLFGQSRRRSAHHLLPAEQAHNVVEQAGEDWLRNVELPAQREHELEAGRGRVSGPTAL